MFVLGFCFLALVYSATNHSERCKLYTTHQQVVFLSRFGPDEWADLLHRLFTLGTNTHTHIWHTLYTQVNKGHMQLVDWLRAS